MVGHYLGVDPGREDDWKSPARREDLKTRPSILCVTQKRAFMPLYIVLGQHRACMPVYIGKSGHLAG